MDTDHNKRPKAIVKKKKSKYGREDQGGLPKAMGSRWGGGSFSFSFSNIREKIKFIQNKKKQNNQLGFISNQQLYGNHLKGSDWVQEQQKRKEEDQLYSDKEDCQNNVTEEDQVIYIQPSISEKRLQQLRKMGRPFYDESFPPNDYSLTGAYGHIPNWDPIQWAKLSKNIKGGKIFEGKVQPCDIMQGFLGDCYFLAGLAAIAERPDRIYNIFLLQETNQMNYFSVKMIYRGKWRTVDVDEHIPFAYGNPAFSKSKNKELWVMIIQKAWAKLYGSYKQLQGGFPQQPLHDLTGAPIKHIFLQNTDGQNQWQYLSEASRKEYAMCASSNPGSDTDQSESGIFQGHAYTFLNATQISFKNQKQRVVQLRNPWGQGQFKGRWSDKDPVWNEVSEAEKKRVGYKKNTSDGVFFMNFQDFMYDFRNVTVAQINDNASYVYDYFIDPQANGAYFTIEVKNASKYSFQIDKTPQRSFTGKMQSNYRYPEACLQIGKIQGNNTQRLRGYISRRRTLFKNYDLTPGKYVAFVKIDFDSKFQKDFEIVLAIYSEYACKIRLATAQQSIKYNGGKQTGWTGKRLSKNQLPPPRQSNFAGTNTKKNNRLKDFNKGKKLQDSSTVLGSQYNNKNSDSSKKNSINLFNDKNNIANLSKKQSQIEVVPKKNKKIRRIQKETVKTEVIEQDPNGQSIVKSHQNQIKKQSVQSKVNGGTNIKTKKMENTIESTQQLLHGQLIKKKEKFKEVVTISQQTPEGLVKEKVSTKEREVETMEQDDDGTESYLRSELENGSNIREIEGSQIQKGRAYNENNRGQNQDNQFRDRDVLKYQDNMSDQQI